jgi:hypothetical protein
MTEALKREAFDIADRWFRVMAEVFDVVEDGPPHAPLWTDTPRDEADRPIWTAAVRVRADVVVTENLKDGPPVDEGGIQSWNRVMYVHPDRFIDSLDWVGHGLETGQEPKSVDEGVVAPTSANDAASNTGFSPLIRAFLLDVDRRASTELSPGTPPA